ncbi:hypothetical protein [Archangium lansingense]|uniref:Uncharacterized protein n=1 Tax=Archangium lansingense TaxID=2995310 RepID=A0ABT4AB60_9BACT|nr:hypothetical protein [Archangium lansinium]MCY1078875.1 hypothetical protein [Archangium lansinium]
MMQETPKPQTSARSGAARAGRTRSGQDVTPKPSQSDDSTAKPAEVRDASH